MMVLAVAWAQLLQVTDKVITEALFLIGTTMVVAGHVGQGLVVMVVTVTLTFVVTLRFVLTL